MSLWSGQIVHDMITIFPQKGMSKTIMIPESVFFSLFLPIPHFVGLSASARVTCSLLCFCNPDFVLSGDVIHHHEIPLHSIDFYSWERSLLILAKYIYKWWTAMN